MNDTYNALHKHFTNWLDTLGYSKGTIRKCKDVVKEFFEYLTKQNIYSITTTNQNHVLAFLEYQHTRENKRYGGTLSNSTLKDYYMSINKLIEFLHQMETKNNLTPIKNKINIDKDERIRKIIPFTIEEIKELQNKIVELYPNYSYHKREIKIRQLQLCFTLYYGCGLRLSEGYKLTPKQIDFNKQTIFIKQGKNYKDRIVPMNNNVYQALQDYIYNFRNQIKCNHQRLFIHSQAGILQDLHYLKKQCNNPEIQNKRLSFHVLRHSIATHLLQKGMEIENIARFLGHSSLTSTQIYTHILNR
jgi:integrase/recombinase XerD